MMKETLRKIKGLAALAIFCMLPTLTMSQDSNFGNWIIYFGNKQLNEKWNIHHEVQYRNYNLVGDLEQLLIRTGLGYTFSKSKHNVLLGYGYILSENYLEDTNAKMRVNEHRIFQQFIIKQSAGMVAFTHRYRFEQRFVEKDFKLRFRYFLGFNIPFGESLKPFYLSAYNEVFLNTKATVFDRNRLYGGLGYKVSDKLKFELGYMNQFFEEGSRDQLNIMVFYGF